MIKTVGLAGNAFAVRSGWNLPNVGAHLYIYIYMRVRKSMTGASHAAEFSLHYAVPPSKIEPTPNIALWSIMFWSKVFSSPRCGLMITSILFVYRSHFRYLVFLLLVRVACVAIPKKRSGDIGAFYSQLVLMFLWGVAL